MFRLASLLGLTLCLAFAIWKMARPGVVYVSPRLLSESWVTGSPPPRKPFWGTEKHLPYSAIKAPSPKSLTELKMEVSKRPQDPKALIKLGTALSQNFHSPDEAVGYLEKALLKTPGNGGAYFELVGAYLQSALVERGCAYFSRLSRTGYRDLAEEALADLKASSGQPEAALPHIKSALAVNPKSDSALRLLASIYLQLGDFPRAEQVRASINSIQTSEGG
jgi:tetratricopeptide (TPR) repeat protein